jgi:hypothetical protein
MTDLTVILLARMPGSVTGKTAGIFQKIGNRDLAGKGIFRAMALLAIHDLFMLPQKRISRFFMVEILDIPIH